MINKSAQIDLWKAYKTPIEIVQYEGDGRVLNFVLISGGQAIDLTAATVVFYATKPSGEDIYDSCTITDATAGKVSFTVTTQTCIEAGTLTCFIEITTATPAVLRTQPFEITVVESEDVSGAIESESEFTALTAALATVSAYDGRITQNENDIAGKVDGAGTVTDGHIVQFDGTTGKTIKGGVSITTTVANPGVNTNLPTEAAVRAAIVAACGGDVTGPESSTNGGLVLFNGTSGKTIKEASGLSGIMKGNGATLATATPHSDYAPPPVQITSTLTALGWNSGEQTINDAAIYSASAPGDVKIAQDATDAEFEAWIDGMVRVTGQAIGSITVKAIGDIPAIDIPVEIEVR